MNYSGICTKILLFCLAIFGIWLYQLSTATLCIGSALMRYKLLSEATYQVQSHCQVQFCSQLLVSDWLNVSCIKSWNFNDSVILRLHWKKIWHLVSPLNSIAFQISGVRTQDITIFPQQFHGAIFVNIEALLQCSQTHYIIIIFFVQKSSWDIWV